MLTITYIYRNLQLVSSTYRTWLTSCISKLKYHCETFVFCCAVNKELLCCESLGSIHARKILFPNSFSTRKQNIYPLAHWSFMTYSLDFWLSDNLRSRNFAVQYYHSIIRIITTQAELFIIFCSTAVLHTHISCNVHWIYFVFI